MTIENTIKSAVASAINSLYEKNISEEVITAQNTRQEFSGDLTVVVFPLLKFSGKPAEETAKDLGEYLKTNVEDITGYNVIKGFLNLVISDKYWVTYLKEVMAGEGQTSPQPPPKGGGEPIRKKPSKITVSKGFQGQPKTIMIEYSQPNTNKPLHLGHLRNNMLGYSLSNILKANGHKVIMANIINDRGIHICKSMLAWQKWGGGETPESSGIKGDKLVGKYYVEFDKQYKREMRELVDGGMDEEEAGKKAPLIKEAQEMLKQWEAGDQDTVKLWKDMNGWVLKGFDETYRNLGVSFDEVYYESDTYLLGKKHIETGLEKGTFNKKDDGSVWCEFPDGKIDPKLVLRGDGTSVYITQDIGTAVQRFEDYNLNQLIYVVGDEQIHHFRVLFKILKKMGYDWSDNCYHLSYGMVELPSGKMKSREGTVVDADDIMEKMIAIAKKLSEELGKLGEISDEEKDKLYEIIGLGALKYYLVKVDPKKKMMFDPEESIDFNGHTGPFIQYTYARIQSLSRKYAEEFGDAKLDLTGNINLEPKERELIKMVHEFPQVIAEAGSALSPALIANYIYELVKGFNNYYQSVPIFKAEDKEVVSFRIGLTRVVGSIIKTGMNLLGIAVPDRM